MSEPKLTYAEQSIYIIAKMVTRRIGQRCAWCSFLTPEEEALDKAAAALLKKYKQQYPEQATHLDEFERTFEGCDPSTAAFLGKADITISGNPAGKQDKGTKQ